MIRSGTRIGQKSPEFQLECAGPEGRETFRLRDQRGRWTALIFYPRDFSLICPTEITSVSQRIDEFRSFRCQPVAISTDTIETHEQWIQTPVAEGGVGRLRFPLAADYRGAVAKKYRVYDKQNDAAQRGLFIIDPDGILQYQSVQSDRIGRGIDELLRLLGALQSDGLCAVNWSQGEPLLDVQKAIQPGRVLSNYRIDELIGSGSFGAVYRASDLVLDRTVAIKVLRPQGFVQSEIALTEARAVAAVSHPNICTVFAVDDSAGVPMIVMEHLAGRPLCDLIPAGGFPEHVVVSLTEQIALGLAAAHGQGVLHRDLKPANMVVSDDGRLKILDFGIAIRLDASDRPGEQDSSAQTGQVCGTPLFMSPEQTRGALLTPQSDVFSFGLVLHQLLTGQSLVHGSDFAQICQCINSIEPARIAHTVQSRFSTLIERMLTHDPSRRATIPEILRNVEQSEVSSSR